MKKYNVRNPLISGACGILLLLSGCGGLPDVKKASRMIIPSLDSGKPQTSFSTPVRKQQITASTRHTTTNTRPLQTVTTAPRNNQAIAAAKPNITQANQLMRSGRRAEAAEMYFRSAFGYHTPQRERIILQAAEISASLGDRNRTTSYLQAASSGSLTPLNQLRYRYVQSLLALHNKQSEQALRLLPSSTASLPQSLRDKIELVRRHARTQQQQAAPRRSIAATNQSINQTATRPVQRPVQRRSLVSTKPTVNYQSPQNQTASVPVQANNPVVHQPQENINRVAILLPDTGTMAKIGDEIYQGVQDAQAIYGNEVLIKRYPANKNNVLNRYQQAVADGADIVIGPLHKETLSALTAQPELLEKPVLSLNYLRSTDSKPHTLYQFGLSPEDEVRQIAELALKRGQLNSVIMVPDSAWGKRLGNAFAQTYQQSGGKILHATTYPVKADSSYLKRVQSLPGKPEGADMIFLAASPTQARMLHPLLKAQAGLMPVYATSHIFSGRTAKNKDVDLDGIIYTEIPYVLKKTAQGSLDKLKFPRLYALGMDSLMLARNLAPLVRQRTLGGQTGQINMTPQRRMQRRMEFATFINGKPHSLGQ